MDGGGGPRRWAWPSAPAARAERRRCASGRARPSRTRSTTSSRASAPRWRRSGTGAAPVLARERVPVTAAGGPETVLRPRFEQTDMMGIVHHSQYWSWFEEARFRFVEDVLAVSLPEMVEQRVYMPVVEGRCRYLRRVTWTDTVAIETRMDRRVGPSFHFHYRARLAGSDVLVATGATKHVFTDASLALKLSVPEFYRRRWAAAVLRHPAAFGSDRG